MTISKERKAIIDKLRRKYGYHSSHGNIIFKFISNALNDSTYFMIDISGRYPNSISFEFSSDQFGSNATVYNFTYKDFINSSNFILDNKDTAIAKFNNEPISHVIPDKMEFKCRYSISFFNISNIDIEIYGNREVTDIKTIGEYKKIESDLVFEHEIEDEKKYLIEKGAYSMSYKMPIEEFKLLCDFIKSNSYTKESVRTE